MEAITTASNRRSAPMHRGGFPLNDLPARYADAVVEVRPAYLAPPTPRSTASAARALRAARWRAVGGSPDREFHHPQSQTIAVITAYSSERSQNALIASGPGWQATFSARVPDEVLAHAVAALVDHAENGSTGADLEAALAGLAEAGWSGAHRRAGTVEAIAPGSLAELRWGPDEDTGQPTMRILAGSPHGLPWYAELRGTACPAPLTEAVLAALASPGPARRRLRDIPGGQLHDLDIAPANPRTTAATATTPGLSPAALATTPGTPILSSPAPPATSHTRRAR
ncbi:DUF317 domain-containing protein [Kitasatospora griseola]|uniref:DUF317 domain-containing protein n=1 Tax=Kitasatospora griseola TaxID=2064 RepID=UPI003441A559